MNLLKWDTLPVIRGRRNNYAVCCLSIYIWLHLVHLLSGDCVKHLVRAYRRHSTRISTIDYWKVFNKKLIFGIFVDKNIMVLICAKICQKTQPNNLWYMRSLEIWHFLSTEIINFILWIIDIQYFTPRSGCECYKLVNSFFSQLTFERKCTHICGSKRKFEEIFSQALK